MTLKSESAIVASAEDMIAVDSTLCPSPQLLVLGSWVGERRLFHLDLFLNASRMALPQDPSTDPKYRCRYADDTIDVASTNLTLRANHSMEISVTEVPPL